MNMKYDSAVMRSLVSSTEARIVEVYNYAIDLENRIGSVVFWDDSKKTELERRIREIKNGVVESARGLKEYLDELKIKMKEFECGE